MIEALQQLGISDEAMALAQGMLLGDKSAIARDTMQQFRTAGMSHILAVSGLHVGIIMSIIWMVLRPVEWGVLLCAPKRMITYYAMGTIKRLLTIAVTFLYVYSIGAPPSAVRAAIMLSLCLMGWMLQRSTSAWRCLILAALLLLAWDPWMLLTPGFQLSFLAVAGILGFSPWLRKGVLIAPWRLLLVSIAAQWFTAPIVAYWFHQVPFLGWLQGLLVVPLMPVMVSLVLLGILFPQWHLLAIAIDALTRWMGWVAQFIGSAERWLLGGHLYFYPEWWQVLLAELLLVSILLYVRLGRASDKK